ncbi:MAG: ABC transporter permease [Candidatus Acidiferrales bacterium]
MKPWRLWFSRKKWEQQLDAELRFHIERQTAENIATGLAPDEARRQAVLQLGAAEGVKEDCREQRRGFWMETLWADIRYGLRILRKNPGFTAVAMLTIALGIGMNTAAFSVVNGVLLNPLPYNQPNQLVSLWWDRSPGQHSSITYLNFLDWQKENTVFSNIGAFLQDDMILTDAGEPERVSDIRISANFFELLGAKPLLGRAIRAEEDQLGGGRVAVISDGFWKRKFGSSPAILSKSITLDGIAYAIVGVVPEKSPLYAAADMFTPLGQFNDPPFRDRRASMGTLGIARMKPGVTLVQARADMNSVARNLSATYPDADKDTGIFVNPLKEDITGDAAPMLYVLFGAVGFVLLIACANVSNLVLARATGRAREFAVRAALGATRGRVIRQLLTESILLAAAGAALGLLFAVWGTRAALAAIPQVLPRADEIGMDLRVLVFTCAAAILVGIGFGLVPALKTSNPDLHKTLKEGGRRSSGTRLRTQNILVIAEMALALVLLAGAGLMIRTLVNLVDVNPGFDPQHVLVFGIAPSAAKVATATQIRATYRDLTARFEEVPGVAAASPLVGALPLTGDSLVPFWIEGRPKPSSAKEMARAQWYAAAPDYLKVMGIPLQHGRFLGAQDTETTPFVVVIDDGFARAYFPGEDPLGKRVNLGIIDVNGAEIVGVVGHVKHVGLGATGALDQRGQIYFSMMQLPDRVLPLAGRASTFVVRATGPDKSVAEAIRSASQRFDSRQVLYDFQPMSKVVSDSIASQRFTMSLLGVFALLALVLSAVGIFGVISYLAGQRTREIGIRMALGAEKWDVFQMVIGQGLRLALAGLAIGAVAALLLTRLLSSFSHLLFGVSASDPITFLIVSVVLTGVALLACYVPARRAMRVDPMVALRYE